MIEIADGEVIVIEVSSSRSSVRELLTGLEYMQDDEAKRAIVIACVSQSLVLFSREELEELAQHFKVKVVTERELISESLNFPMDFVDFHKLDKAKSFKTKQLERRKAFKDANILCRKVVKDYNRVSRGRR